MSSVYPSEWSDWDWNEEIQRHFCWRHDAYGQTEYMYNPPYDNETTSADPGSYNNARQDSYQAEYALNYDYGPTANDTVNELANSLAQTRLSHEYPNSPQAASSASEPRTTSTYQYASVSGTQGSNRRITTRNPDTRVDELDPEYQVHTSRHFKFGAIFKVLWSEPYGSTGTQVTGVRKRRHAKFGEPSYSSIRRFLVVDDTNSGHSLCLPILTYGGRATNKPGIKAEDHAVIYTSRNPVKQSGEELQKKSIRVKPKTERHKLDANSRLNYAKVYTVEHNVKVLFVGSVISEHEQRVVDDYRIAHPPLGDRPYPFDSQNTEHQVSYASGGANLETNYE